VALTCRDYGISQQARWIWCRRYPVAGPAADRQHGGRNGARDALGRPGRSFTLRQ
jgi:hypothetical protein